MSANREVLPGSVPAAHPCEARIALAGCLGSLCRHSCIGICRASILDSTICPSGIKECNSNTAMIPVNNIVLEPQARIAAPRARFIPCHSSTRKCVSGFVCQNYRPSTSSTHNIGRAVAVGHVVLANRAHGAVGARRRPDARKERARPAGLAGRNAGHACPSRECTSAT